MPDECIDKILHQHLEYLKIHGEVQGMSALVLYYVNTAMAILSRAEIQEAYP